MIDKFPMKYACDFQPRPNVSDVLIVTFVNSAWIAMARNWICSAKKVGLKDNLYMIAFEEGLCSQLPEVPCYEHPGTNFKRTVFGKPEYQKLVIERTRVILKLLSCWPKVALVDADITFLQNPLEYLEKLTADKDIVFQADSTRVKFLDVIIPYVFHYICGGFIYMKSNYAVKHLWLSVLNYQENFLWNDQAGLNICIRHSTQSARWDTLDADHFPNGQQYFGYGEKSNVNMIVHANHLEGKEKIVRMISSGVWCHAPEATKICNGTSYKTMCTNRTDIPEWCDNFVRVCEEKYNVHISESPRREYARKMKRLCHQL